MLVANDTGFDAAFHQVRMMFMWKVLTMAQYLKKFGRGEIYLASRLWIIFYFFLFKLNVLVTPY